jgi:rhodanese-related sulfurtransferase
MNITKIMGVALVAALMGLGPAVWDRAQGEANPEINSAADLKAMMDKHPQLLLVDAVPHIHYRLEHIPGAQNFEFPNGMMESWDTARTGGKTLEDFKTLLGSHKKRPVVFYCFGTICSRSAQGVEWARKLGYENLYRFPGGIVAWKKAGYPVAKGD